MFINYMDEHDEDTENRKGSSFGRPPIVNDLDINDTPISLVKSSPIYAFAMKYLYIKLSEN